MAAEQPKIAEILEANLAAGKESFSFEFFPPKTDKGDENLLKSIPEYKAQSPVFIDFTWGAGGTTSEKTTMMCKKCKEMGLTVNMHLTCTNMDEGKVKEALDFCQKEGIKNILALRGDPPAGEAWKPSAEGFKCALDLITYIKTHYGDYFSIGCAGYPEGHPDAIGDAGVCSEDKMAGELEYLKKKVDAGAQFIITQLFYDVQLFLKWVAKCREVGIKVPILPGMLPMTTYGGFGRMTGLCKTFVPEAVRAKMEELKEDDAAVKAYGIELVANMITEMKAAGIKHIHYYTLNQTYSTFEIMKKLGDLTPIE